jgi:hypothetical protein
MVAKAVKHSSSKNLGHHIKLESALRNHMVPAGGIEIKPSKGRGQHEKSHKEGKDTYYDMAYNQTFANGHHITCSIEDKGLGAAGKGSPCRKREGLSFSRPSPFPLSYKTPLHHATSMAPIYFLFNVTYRIINISPVEYGVKKPYVISSLGRIMMKTIRNHPYVSLLLFTLVLYLAGNQLLAVTDTAESNYALTAKEMVLSGNWISPQIYGRFWYDKPIFYYWELAF